MPMTATWERRQAARFLCFAAWRCDACETPWFASLTAHRAMVAVIRHEKACHGRGGNLVGPVLRYAHGPIRVPADLPDGTRWALEIEGWTDALEGMAQEYRDGRSTDDQSWADRLDRWVMAIKRLSPLWWYSEEFVAVDGGMLGDVRNRCYEVALNGECQGPDGEGWREDTCPCYRCGWCYCWTAMHRIDYWLDKAKSPKSLYIYDVDPSIEGDWRRCGAGSS